MTGPYSADAVHQGENTNLCWAACLLFMQNAHRNGVGPGGTGGKKWTLSDMVKHYSGFQRQNDWEVTDKWVAPDAITAKGMIKLMQRPEWELTAFERASTNLSGDRVEEYSRRGWFILGYRPEGGTTGHYNCVGMDEDGFIWAMEPYLGKVVCKTLKSFANSKWSNQVIGYYPSSW